MQKFLNIIHGSKSGEIEPADSDSNNVLLDRKKKTPLKIPKLNEEEPGEIREHLSLRDIGKKKKQHLNIANSKSANSKVSIISSKRKDLTQQKSETSDSELSISATVKPKSVMKF